MKSDVILIDNQGNGFEQSVAETQKVADYKELSHKESLHLQLCAEEMLSLVKSVTGELKASFWIESEEGKTFRLHVSANANLDKEKRAQLLGTSTSGKNEAARSFLGAIRNVIDEALTADANHNHDLPEDLMADLPNHVIECVDPEWDQYEQSTLRRLANTITVGIRGSRIDITVTKTFA